MYHWGEADQARLTALTASVSGESELWSSLNKDTTLDSEELADYFRDLDV